VSDAGRKGGTDEKIPGSSDFHGATDQTVPANNKEALLRFCLEIRMEKPTKQIVSYWKLREIM
jgi:hypothetical protein